MAKQNKTIAVTLRFWTNDLKVEGDEGPELSCWDSGVAILEGNTDKGIEHAMQIIQCPEDIVPAIKELFRKAGILVVSNNRKPRILSHRRRKQ